jgi:dTDP-4-amino-4,6-dideoxygalactose transaminase
MASKKSLYSRIIKLFSTSLLGFISGHYYLNKEQLQKIRLQIGKNSKEHIRLYESKFSNLVGKGDAVSFASGRMGFYALMKVMNIGPGDEVILCGYTCSVMPNAVLRTGAKPVYSDIDSSTFGSSASSIKKCISSKTKLVVAQHSFGIPCEIDQIYQVCQLHNILLVEDCALTLGSTLNNKKVGTFGNAAIFSTDHSKPINTIIGGFIYSEDSTIIEKLRIVQNYSDDLPIKKQKAIWDQFIIERLFAKPYKYGVLQVVNSITNLIRKKIGRVSPFLDEDDGPGDMQKTYPYPAKLPTFVAFIGLYELDRWKLISAERCKSLQYYISALEQSSVKNYIPKAYYDIDRTIIPLRFVFSHPNSGYIRSKLNNLINVDEILFMIPIVNCNAPLERYYFEKRACPNSEEVGPNMVNFPLASPHKMDKIISKVTKVAQS